LGIPAIGTLFLTHASFKKVDDAIKWIKLQQENIYHTLYVYSTPQKVYYLSPLVQDIVVDSAVTDEIFRTLEESKNCKELLDKIEELNSKKVRLSYKSYVLLRRGHLLLVFIQFKVYGCVLPFSPKLSLRGCLIESHVGIIWSEAQSKLTTEIKNAFSTIKAIEKKVDEDLKIIEDKDIQERLTKAYIIIKKAFSPDQVIMEWDTASHHLLDNSTWPFHVHFRDRSGSNHRLFYNVPTSWNSIGDILKYLDATIPP